MPNSTYDLISRLPYFSIVDLNQYGIKFRYIGDHIRGNVKFRYAKIKLNIEYQYWMNDFEIKLIYI